MMCTFFESNLIPNIIPLHNDVSNHPGCEDERCGLSKAKARTAKNQSFVIAFKDSMFAK